MSQYPDPRQNPQYSGYPQAPLPYSVPHVASYYGGGGVVANPRPTSVTTVAIIGIILGSVSVLATGPSFVVNLIMATNGGRNPLAPQLPRIDQTVMAVQAFQALGNFIMASIMLVCCIGAMKLKPFAPKVLMPWSYVMLGWAALIMIVTITWLQPEMKRNGQSFMRRRPTSQRIETAGKTIGVLLVGALMCTVPLGVLIFWTRPHVKAAFGENVGPPPASPYPPASTPPGGISS